MSMKEYDEAIVAFDACEKRKRINKRNRRRSVSMETKVMNILSGFRVPMSGAGAIKGDGLAYCPIGSYIVECKTRKPSITADGRKYIRLEKKWLEKIDEESRYMGTRFGSFALQFYYDTKFYFFLPVWVFLKFDNLADSIYTIEAPDKEAYPIYKDVLNEHMNPYILLKTSVGDFVIMNIHKFVDLQREFVNEQERSTSKDS